MRAPGAAQLPAFGINRDAILYEAQALAFFRQIADGNQPVAGVNADQIAQHVFGSVAVGHRQADKNLPAQPRQLFIFLKSDILPQHIQCRASVEFKNNIVLRT